MSRFLKHFAFITALTATTVLAQTTGTAPTHPAPNPANIAQHRVKVLTTLLTLTTNQQAQAVTIFTNSATANLATETSMRTARQSLRTAISGNDAGALSQITSTIGALTGQIELANAQAEIAFYQTLTPAQQTQYTQYQSEGRGRFGPGFRR